MTYCVLFIIYMNLFICFPSPSFSFKLCVQLCDDVCGVQVVNYSMDCSCKMNCIILNPNRDLYRRLQGSHQTISYMHNRKP